MTKARQVEKGKRVWTRCDYHIAIVAEPQYRRCGNVHRRMNQLNSSFGCVWGLLPNPIDSRVTRTLYYTTRQTNIPMSARNAVQSEQSTRHLTTCNHNCIAPAGSLVYFNLRSVLHHSCRIEKIIIITKKHTYKIAIPRYLAPQ